MNVSEDIQTPACVCIHYIFITLLRHKSAKCVIDWHQGTKILSPQPFNWGLRLKFGIGLKLRHTGGTSRSPGNILHCHVVTTKHKPHSLKIGMLCKMKIKTECNHIHKHYEMFLSMWFTVMNLAPPLLMNELVFQGCPFHTFHGLVLPIKHQIW